MQFIFPPLDFTDLAILLATCTIILLITAQITSYLEIPFVSSTIAARKLNRVGVVAGVLFLLTIGIKVLGISGA